MTWIDNSGTIRYDLSRAARRRFRHRRSAVRQAQGQSLEIMSLVCQKAVSGKSVEDVFVFNASAEPFSPGNYYHPNFYIGNAVLEHLKPEAPLLREVAFGPKADEVFGDALHRGAGDIGEHIRACGTSEFPASAMASPGVGLAEVAAYEIAEVGRQEITCDKSSFSSSDSHSDLETFTFDELPDELPGAMGVSDNDFDFPPRVSLSQGLPPERVAPSAAVDYGGDNFAYTYEDQEIVLPIANVGCGEYFPLRLQRSLFCSRLPANSELFAIIMSGFDQGSAFRSAWMEVEVTAQLRAKSAATLMGRLQMMTTCLERCSWPTPISALVLAAIKDTNEWLKAGPSAADIDKKVIYLDDLMNKAVARAGHPC